MADRFKEYVDYTLDAMVFIVVITVTPFVIAVETVVWMFRLWYNVGLERYNDRKARKTFKQYERPE